MSDSAGLVFMVVGGGLLLIALAIGYFAGAPVYKVWSAGKEGEAELTRARQNRQVKVEEAQANLEAEKLNAQSEVVRAKGAAEAMSIEGGSLTPTYIQYLWVRSMSTNSPTLIYVPTEASLPILEAQRQVPPPPAKVN